MITQKQAEQLVYERINRPDAYWPDKPEMIVVRTTEHELGWLVFYDSRPHHETGEIQYAIAGNAPFLVSREDGTMFPTGTAAPFEERVREAERKLRAHLQSLS
jgi:cupin superfamily acireductone dioxygenase involved in methionine salvage